MSFSSKTKEELLQRRLRGKGEKLCMLVALINTAGALTLGRGGKLGLQFLTESYAVGKYIAQLATGMYPVEAAVALREQDRLRSRLTEVKLSGPGMEELLTSCGVAAFGPEGMEFVNRAPMEQVRTAGEKKAFLRGAFLGGGSVADPKRGYHLEFVCHGGEFAGALCGLINEFELNAKSVRRKESYVVYLKDGERISDLLTLIGASGSTLEMEDARVYKNVRNYINRTNNCETANLEKTVRASLQQREEILLIKRAQGLESLPQPLRDVAEARLNHPDASLAELSKLLNVSRSGVNHRLNRLNAIAHDLQIEKGEL